MIEEERIKRSLVDQVRTQQAQINQLQTELNQRHMDAATASIRGFELLVALAAAGNPAARLALKSLTEALEQARTVQVGLVIAKS